MNNESNKEFVQLVNTAIIKSKEKKIDSAFQDRLTKTCESPVMKSLSLAISDLADTQKISHDQAAMRIVETVRELDNVWDDYIMMEGISNLKDTLNGHTTHNF